MNGLNIADNIVRLRHKKKITQEQLADFIGVTKASVSKWENQQSTPDITILPRLATFFDVTIDELVGYTPQLSKEQIQRIYQRLGKDFAERPFEEVMKETQEYVKRYYSCYPFLLQICILWLNHCKMAENEERQKSIWLCIEELCRHINTNCKDMKIRGNAIVIQTVVYFQLGRIQEVIDELEDFSFSNQFGNQSSVLLAQAYAMLNEKEKAESYAQIGMYDNVMNLLANATCYLWIHYLLINVFTAPAVFFHYEGWGIYKSKETLAAQLRIAAVLLRKTGRSRPLFALSRCSQNGRPSSA